ncbi:carbohydrate sulfotransferase 15-like [Apostichopus japonicus]|uniref:carbohydrate sulfotransferase 15-like n=1 Tax=Stichopus japonicus TaxID=307972 RepID=UPI003AB1FF58
MKESELLQRHTYFDYGDVNEKMDQRRMCFDQVSRHRFQLFSFIAVSIASLVLTIYHIKANPKLVIPEYSEELLKRTNMFSQIRRKLFAWDRIKNECLSGALKGNLRYQIKDSCIDGREKAVKIAKKRLAVTVTSGAYARYRKSKGNNSAPLKLYRLAPKIFNEVPDNFLEQYENPCWRHKGSHVYCLPYFYVIGMPKCGSSDLFDKLTSHPQIIRPKWKEPGFWNKLHYIRQPHDLGVYMEYFKDFREAIQTSKRKLITGDGTVASMWSLFDVQFLKDGVGFGLPDVLKAIQPEAKFFIILRDPVERLFSDYHYFGDFRRTPEDFHRKVLIALQEFHKCKQRLNDDLACIGVERIWSKDCIARVSLGLYSVLLREWFKVFPANQFFVIDLAVWESDCVGVMTRAYQFLALDPIPEDELKVICAKRTVLSGKRTKITMGNETRHLLNCLYRPYQQDLRAFLSTHSLDERNLV